MTATAIRSEHHSLENRLNAVAEMSERVARAFEEVGVTTATTDEQLRALLLGEDQGAFHRAKSHAQGLRYAYEQEGLYEFVCLLDASILEPLGCGDRNNTDERWLRAVVEAPFQLRAAADAIRTGLADALPEIDYSIPSLGDPELAKHAADLAAEIWRVRCYWEASLYRQLKKQVIARRLSIDPDGPTDGPAVDLTVRGAESLRFIRDWLSANRGAEAERMFHERVVLPLEAFEKESWKCCGAKNAMDAVRNKQWPSHAVVNTLRDAARNLSVILKATIHPPINVVPQGERENRRAGTDPSRWRGEAKLALLRWLLANQAARPRRVIASEASKAGAGEHRTVERNLADLASAGWLSEGKNGTCLSEAGIRKAKKALKIQ